MLFSETNVGSFCAAVRFGSNSSATTEPTLGAIFPVALAGLRAICAQV